MSNPTSISIIIPILPRNCRPCSDLLSRKKGCCAYQMSWHSSRTSKTVERLRRDKAQPANRYTSAHMLSCRHDHAHHSEHNIHQTSHKRCHDHYVLMLVKPITQKRFSELCPAQYKQRVRCSQAQEHCMLSCKRARF